jgi:citrate lyase subunit beta/citryl-CoA lyase
MTVTVRPRRSVLYMPGSNARALEKGRTLPADALILDLEDAVAPDVKETARRQVAEAVAAGGYGGREIAVRINGLDGPWGRDDLTAVATCGADAILLPKVESAAMVAALEEAMDAGGAPAETTIWCMMETPLGMLHAEEIAAASPRIACLVMGTSDLAKDLHASHTRASASACLRRAPMASRSSTVSTSTSPTMPASPNPAARAANWASTARP